MVQYNKSLSNLNKLHSLSLSHCVPTETVHVLLLCIFAEYFFSKLWLLRYVYGEGAIVFLRRVRGCKCACVMNGPLQG